jgi:hypothetical protein
MSLSFSDVLTRLASQAQVSLDEDTGLPNLSRQEEHRFTLYLNEAATWVWRGLFEQWTLPDLITGTEVTLATGGIIAAADIDSATFWTVWDSDPRLALPEARLRLQNRATAKANGDLIVEGGTAGDTVFVIHRLRIPKWTAVLASGFGATVSADTRLWNKECGSDGDGHVYRALAADVSPDAFETPTAWLPVTLPETLLEPLTAKALANKLRTDGQPAIADSWETSARMWMESRAIEAERQPHEKPWLYNANA